MSAKILKIAVPCSLYRVFDYLPAKSQQTAVVIGSRALVSFGRRQLVGIVTGFDTESDVPVAKLKPVIKILPDPIPGEIVDLTRWAANYYQYPLGDALQQALPALLRQPEENQAIPRIWQLTPEAREIEIESLKRAPRQAEVFKQLQQLPDGMDKDQLNQLDFNWRDAVKSLEKKGLVQQRSVLEIQQTNTASVIDANKPELSTEQLACIKAVADSFDQFKTFLLQGITGSGKTEVYLHLVEQAIARQQQCLILVPEINLTPQLIQRFKQRFTAPIAVLHSGLNNSERLLSWQLARANKVSIIIGTRSALFTPLAKPGLIIIDEEHDSSYKQQDSLRYHARDLSLVRAKRLNIPVLLGSATPSLESLYNCQQDRYQRLTLTQRAGHAKPPTIQLLDVRRKPMQEGLADYFLELMRKHLAQGSQVLLFLNRRGFSPALLCHDCGWVMPCPRCDARLTYHQYKNLMRCHHCGHETRPPTTCPECKQGELINIGIGTERLEVFLKQEFPTFNVSRIDSDTTRRKGSLDKKLTEAQSGEANILIGTQMLAKGHDFPHVTLVGILDVDSSLFSSDFRAPEFMAQQLVQVAGRAGRAEKPGHVVIQTHHPEHPFLQLLLNQGYEAFAENALDDRKMAAFPPFSSLALIRAEATDAYAPGQFLQQVANQLQQQNLIDIFGPMPSPMEKRAGRFRYQLLLQANDRSQLHTCLQQAVSLFSSLPTASKVRWSVDIDPQSML